MFNELIRYPIEHEALRWDAKEVVKDIELEPHLFVRVTLTGAQFPMMAQEAVVRVGDVRSHHVVISDDRLTASAYFDRQPPSNRPVEFGFGDVMLLRFQRPFGSRDVPRLDRARLPKGIRQLREG